VNGLVLMLVEIKVVGTTNEDRLEVSMAEVEHIVGGMSVWLNLAQLS
jgi:hypothetical protein